MGWNRRVLAKRFPCGTVELTVYDVYYDKDGVPNGRSALPSSVFSGDNSLDWLRKECKQIEESFDKPIIDIDNFPNEFKN